MARVRTDAEEKGINGAIARANELVAATPNPGFRSRFDNPANVEVHRRTTARKSCGISAIARPTHHHRRRHRRAHHRLRRGAEAGLAKSQGVRRRAGAVAAAQRREAGAAPDPGSRRGTSFRASSTRDVLDGVIDVDAGRSEGDGAARRARRGRAHRHFFGRFACRRSSKSCPSSATTRGS